jgi:integrase
VKKMTAAMVEKIKPTERRIEQPDSMVKGLMLIVQPTGAKSWQVRYRASGARRRMALGSYPMVSLALARKAANEALLQVHNGADPVADKEASKGAQLSDRDRVESLIEEFAKRHLSTLKSGQTVKRELDRHVVAVWGSRDIHDISKRDVIDLLDSIADSGRAVTANRVRAYLNKFLNWCVERDVLDQSPAMGVKPVAKETSRDRVLTDDEIRWFWMACNHEGYPWGVLGKLLLMSAQRVGEVVGISVNEIKGDTWHLAGERTKNGRAHDVPISAEAKLTLDAIELIKGDAGLLMTTNGKTPLSGFHKGRNRLANRMIEIASQEAGRAVEVPHWTFHDLRRTAATGMARLGIPVRVTEAVLNHVSGTGGGIVAVYQRHDYADEKRAALNAWAQFLADVVEGRTDNVISIKGIAHDKGRG